jgi:hypothetical protein
VSPCSVVRGCEGEDMRRSEGEAVRYSEALESKGLIRFSSLFFSSSSSFYLFIFYEGLGSGACRSTPTL